MSAGSEDKALTIGRVCSTECVTEGGAMEELTCVTDVGGIITWEGGANGIICPGAILGMCGTELVAVERVFGMLDILTTVSDVGTLN